MTSTTPIAVPTSPLLPVVLTVIRYLLTALGAYLVTRGWFTDQTVNDLIGSIMIVVPILFGAVASKRNVDKLQKLEPYAPDSVAQRSG